MDKSGSGDRMNAPGLPPPPKPWPPLRVSERSTWIRFRDLALTLLAWAVLTWLLKDLVYLAYDFLRHPIFELTTALPPDVALLWSRLWVLIVLAALLASGLLLWAVKERHRLRAMKPFPAPPALTVGDQAAWFRADAAAVAAARNFKVTDIQFHKDGTFAALDGRKPAGRVSAASLFRE